VLASADRLGHAIQIIFILQTWVSLAKSADAKTLIFWPFWSYGIRKGYPHFLDIYCLDTISSRMECHCYGFHISRYLPVDPALHRPIWIKPIKWGSFFFDAWFVSCENLEAQLLTFDLQIAFAAIMHEKSDNATLACDKKLMCVCALMSMSCVNFYLSWRCGHCDGVGTGFISRKARNQSHGN
jgi:hypothetical protein